MATRPEWKMRRTGVRWACIAMLLCGSIGTMRVHGQMPVPAVSLERLLQLGPAELEALYRGGVPAAIPSGRVRGTVLLSPGTWRTRPLARSTRLVWQGKVFDPVSATAVNRFFGLRTIRAQVYQGASWLDGAPALVLDYSQTSRIYAGNRDEIRQVAPGLFLGLMYDRTTDPPSLTMYFVLEEQSRPIRP
jgi:hypothetical protein